MEGETMMDINEDNKTRKWIIEALLALLERKAYHDITISQIVDRAGLGRRTFYRYFKSRDEVMEYTAKLLMDEFSETLLRNRANDQETIAVSYFEFWETHIDLLLLLKKARLLYFIGDNLPSLLYCVAVKTGHVPDGISAGRVEEEYLRYKYEFTFKLAGFWAVTVSWCSENPRKTPAEMGRLINDMLK